MTTMKILQARIYSPFYHFTCPIAIPLYRAYPSNSSDLIQLHGALLTRLRHYKREKRVHSAGDEEEGEVYCGTTADGKAQNTTHTAFHALH